MKKSLLLMPLFMAFLCGCKESSSIQTYQPPINVETSVINEESTVKKTTKASSKTSTKTTETATTTTTVPKTNTSTIKDLIIDGNGNLVATKSNNTFAIIGNVQGQKGAKGDTGERGAQGEKGQDGRGIASCSVDSNGDLIITYTDGATQNAGNVRQEVIVHDYEQVGYLIRSSTQFPTSNNVWNIAVSNLIIELIDVNDANPSQKYTYKATMTVEPHSHQSGQQPHLASFSTDVVYTVINGDNTFCCNRQTTNSPTTLECTFYTSMPCVDSSISFWEDLWG